MFPVDTVKLPILQLWQLICRSVLSCCWQRQSNGREGSTELCYLSRAKEYFLVSLSLTRHARSSPFLAAMRTIGGVLFVSPSNAPCSVGSGCGHKPPHDLFRSLCQMFLNEKVLIIFSINPRQEKAAFLLLVASLTSQTVTR